MSAPLTPRLSGPHRRYKRLDASVPTGMVAIIAVLTLLVLMYFLLPPIR
jgi:hypothetical protein